MSFKSIILAAMTASLAMPAFAESVISVSEAYARVSTKMSKSGAAFMMIENTGETDDRLADVRSDIATRTELHTHKADADGNMQMLHVKEGFPVPAGGAHMLQRGGDHVMFMGLSRGLAHGDVIKITLVFEQAGEIEVEVPVDLERKPNAGEMKMDHSQGMAKTDG